MKGLVHFECLKQNQIIEREIFCKQFEQIKSGLEGKQPALISGRTVFIHDNNAWPHTARMPFYGLEQFNWETVEFIDGP